MSSSNGPLLITSELKAKENTCTVTTMSYFRSTKNILRKVSYISKIYYHMSLQDFILSSASNAPTLNVHILLLTL
jgi:hypothetical protein